MFEGKIIYSNRFTSKVKNLSDEQLSMIVGTKQEYFIKGSSYKSILNGQSIVLQQYDHQNNRLYNKRYNVDTLYWFDASRNTDSIESFEIKVKVEKVLGKECNAIIMRTKSGITTIYYASSYQIDSKAYGKHKYNNWAFYLSQTNALPLKIVIENRQFKMESTATEITPLIFDETFFKMNEKIPVKQVK
jgi:hypothetical protein